MILYLNIWFSLKTLNEYEYVHEMSSLTRYIDTRSS